MINPHETGGYPPELERSLRAKGVHDALELADLLTIAESADDLRDVPRDILIAVARNMHMPNAFTAISEIPDYLIQNRKDAIRTARRTGPLGEKTAGGTTVLEELPHN